MVVGVEYVLPIREHRHSEEVILSGATGIGPDREFVLLAKGIEGAIEVGVKTVVDLVIVIGAANDQCVRLGRTHRY